LHAPIQVLGLRPGLFPGERESPYGLRREMAKPAGTGPEPCRSPALVLRFVN
jgi:hypothetical protein